jgi:4-amino-4-deoxy-L-arabinose transferase-like glycosyltransferase
LSTERKIGHQLAIALLALAVFVLLFVTRAVDDNRLTSWRWVFGAVGAGRVYILLAGGVLIAWFLSRFRLPSPGALFAASFALAAVFWQQADQIVDTSRYFTQAKHLELYGVGYFLREWGNGIGAWTDMPLVPFIYGLIFKFFGESRLFVQIFTTLLYSLTAVFTYLLGRDLWDEEVGSCAGLLLLGMPYLFTQVPTMMVDVPSMFVLTLSVFAFDRAIMRGGPAWAGLSALTVILALFSKYSLWPMLSVLPVVFVARLKDGPPLDMLRRAVAVSALALAPAGAIVLYKYEVIAGQIRLLLGYQGPGLERWTESFTSTFLFQVHPFITAGALYSAYAAVKKRDLRYLAVLWLVLLMLVAGIRRIRYVVPLFPMVSLMASYGINSALKGGPKRFCVLAAVFSSVAVAVFAFMPFLEGVSMHNLKDAGGFLDTLKEKDARVFVVAQDGLANPAVSVPMLDLYTRKKLYYKYENIHLPPPEKVRASPLRFTWLYKNPAYYELPAGTGAPGTVVVITGSARAQPPLYVRKEIRGYKVLRAFTKTTGHFRFRTIVTVYQRGEG